ncbi:MAG: FAD:protein FMN transferase, partial [Candidatus Eisenbacteria bacterium]|nr:FAD:protein FMN transferase [Candidatus Eisenbacteria bacterium]
MIQGRRVAGVPNRLFLLAAASLLAVAGVGASGCSGERNATPGAGASASGSAESSPSSADASRGGAAGTSVPARSDHAPGTVASGADASLSIVTYRVRTMGTMGDIKVAVADSAAGWSFAHAGKRAWDRVDSLMSNWTETSEVARINRDGAAGVIVQPEVAQVIDRALSIGRESGGAFDITVEPLVRLWGFLAGTPHVPSNEQIEAMRQRVGLAQVDFTPSTRGLRFAGPGVHIDLGGIAKGYGVDAAVLDMAAAGARIMMIDLSGNIRTVGLPPGRDHWTIGVRDPKKRWPYFAQLDVDE